jgi:hypothetical protein
MIKKSSKLKAEIGDSMTETDVKELAMRIFKHEVFTDRHCRNADEVRSSFPVLTFMKKKDIKRLEKMGMIWEAYNKAAPMAVNGQPMFFSCHLVSKLDADRVWKMHDRIKASTDSI